MSSMNYQKVYMNQIHSSSLLCQLSHMWKGQMLCDAIIKTGQVITKAHRVVLVAACPMLQSMENASAGSHLEVRLAADIKQESVNTFLQYLYEGFMMLTEENVRDVEKVGRLLQVDSVIKCCADFYKCMNAKTGAPFPGSSYKYSFSGHDLAEFRHVRATGLQKTASERIIKRVSDFPRPGSPGSKRPRLYRGGSPSDVTVIGSDKADDTASMSHSYMSGAPDPWDRVPKLGSGMSRQGATGRNSQPGVIEIIEERIELVQTEPPEKDSGQPSSSRSSQKSAAVSIAVTSQFNTEPDISVVNVFGSPETQSTTAASNAITSSSSSRGSITVSPLTIFQEPHPQSSSAPEPSSSSSTVESSGQVSEIQFAGFSQRQDVVDSVYGMGKQQKSVDSQLTSTPHQRPFPVSVSPITQPKPFAAGSAVQAGISSPSSMSLPLGSPSSSKSVQKPRSAPASPAERARDSRRASEAAGMHSTADMTPDLSIVKIESSNHETGGLDMHVDMPEEGVMRIHPGRMPDEQEEASDKEIEDWAREEMSNEGSNISGDQNNSWYMGTFKEWLTIQGEDPNFEQTTAVKLNHYLVNFYRYYHSNENLPDELLRLYPFELTRYLQAKPFYRDVDVTYSPEFASSSRMLESIMGGDVETATKPINPAHLQILYSSSLLSCNDPFSLQNKVWMDVNLYFGVLSRIYLRQLRKESFVLATDPNVGRRYFRIIDSHIGKDKVTARMYEQIGSPFCPVSSLLLYLTKLNPNSDVFFQQPRREGNLQYWYTETAVGKNVHSNKLATLCAHAGINTYYKNTALRMFSRSILSYTSDLTNAYSDEIERTINGLNN
ncbi:uncharacterized protein LOC110459952 isoform X6 [Mizuhopecten yessoensis]|uniref:uncharacterized protein LOC110459952 isoform X6 n=1 Tax=Mizuhopecten yessoensis TaxID=6573 RepID=UPI000B4584FD|nr:uncharacterized protein LOC110459952 isoform X6 [Mizuhopecten yessoensis]